jgi:hypothetical protein
MAQDHKFRVSEGRLDGRGTEEFESFTEAAHYQYHQNTLNTAVGYEPSFKLWLIDEDGHEVLVKTQL